MNGKRPMHQFIDRNTQEVKSEILYGDKIIRFLYSRARERSSLIYKMLNSSRLCSILGFFYYDSFIGSKITRTKAFMDKLGIDYTECLDPPKLLNTPRKIFERKIRYWDIRPMPEGEDCVVAPADSKVHVGSSIQTRLFYIKDKFFQYKELIGANKGKWIKAFRGGDFAVFRLTPDKYHYNHMPVSGVVRDFYSIDGGYQSCHPEALVTLCTPYSKNRRFITIIDTDVKGGTHIGLVAMIEVAALLIGDVIQCYSETRYDSPQKIIPNMFLKKGQPKSLFRPGSSTVILLFQRDMVAFSPDIIENNSRDDVISVFSRALGIPIVETEVKVRSLIGKASKKIISS
ncbi:MAG: phosphatidylserine decarboxylase [Syntrophorhabdaceae bacterium]|nr:phosphatidylserine decarboxylase [Syntrophorhabdaceae bacterium]